MLMNVKIYLIQTVSCDTYTTIDWHFEKNLLNLHVGQFKFLSWLSF
mgnify:CR=1 FL=1